MHRAWLIVAIAFYGVMVAYGTNYAFGVFLKPLMAELGWGRGPIAGAFALSMVVHGITYIPMGRLTDTYGPKRLVLASGLILALGFAAMSLVSELWHIYVAYGIIIGVGMGGFWVPLISTVSRWFQARRGLATGIVASGVGVGISTLSPLVAYLILTMNWRIAYISLALIVLTTIGFSLLLKREPADLGLKPYGESPRVATQSTAIIHKTQDVTGRTLSEAFHSKPFWLLSTAAFCIGIGHGFPSVHYVAYATDVGIPEFIAASAFATLGLGSTLGRIGLGALQDRIGARSTLLISSLIMTAMMIWISDAKDVVSFYCIGFMYGFFYGGAITQLPSLTAQLYGLRAMGSIYGVVTFWLSSGIATGSTVGGFIFDVSQSYIAVVLTSIVSFLVTTTSAFSLRSRKIV